MKTSRRDFLTMAAAAVASLVIPKAARAETDDGTLLDTGQPKTIRRVDLRLVADEVFIDGEWQDASEYIAEPGTTIVGADSAASPSYDDLLWDLSKGVPLEFTIHGTYPEPADGAAIRDMLRGDGTDIISDTTPTWGGGRFSTQAPGYISFVDLLGFQHKGRIVHIDGDTIGIEDDPTVTIRFGARSA